jgi:outer membrane protein assembly factor BamB
MHRMRIWLPSAAAAAILLTGAAAAQRSTAAWPQWRGPFNTGMAVGSAPLSWSDESNVRWTMAIPGRGHSTPVIAGRRLFLTTAVPTGRRTAPDAPSRAGGGADAGLEHRFEVMAIDRDSGRVDWQRTAAVATPHEGYHRTYGSFASNSPATDGERVYAFFGSRGLFAYTVEGEPVWRKDFGVKMRMDMAFGEGTPLAIEDGRLLLHVDHLDLGFLVMLEAATGREIWRVKRTEPYNWAAPYVATRGGRRQIVMSGLTVRGYDYDTGALAWEAEGLGENTIPQPVHHQDLVFAMSGHTVKNLMAIRLDNGEVAWSTARGVSYTPSPLLHDGIYYFVSDNGLVSALDAATGRPHYQQQRLPKAYSFKASPVGAGGRLYLASEDEDTVVLRLGRAFEVLATNRLAGQSFIASPVVADGVLYLRSRTQLFAIAAGNR